MVVSEQYYVIGMVGLHVKEACLERSSNLIDLRVMEGRGDTKPLARDLGRSQELMIETGSRMPLLASQVDAPSFLHTGALAPQVEEWTCRNSL